MLLSHRAATPQGGYAQALQLLARGAHVVFGAILGTGAGGGREGCIEQFVSGPELARERASSSEPEALARYAERLARALAHVVNLVAPDVIVLGGGVSNVGPLYGALPPLVARYVYRREIETPVRRAAHGDASGVRGAAMLWDAA